MKLITEVFEDNIETIVESNEAGGKTYKIKGVMMESGCVNRNKRFYTEAVLMKETKRYVSEYVQKKRALGELNHPPSPTVNLDRVAILIEVLSPKGKQVYGEAKVLSTPMGNIVQNLIKEGVKLGVSSRGMGSLENKNGVNYVKEDFTLAAIDVVADPSAPNAFVDGILEGKEWIWDNGLLKEVQINEYAKQLRKAPKRKLEENAIRLFSDFLRKL